MSRYRYKITLTIYLNTKVKSIRKVHAAYVDCQSAENYTSAMFHSKQKFVTEFGDRIKQLRRIKGISQEELADLAKIHRTYMGRIERGESNPPIYTVYKIVKVLKVKPAEFLSL